MLYMKPLKVVKGRELKIHKGNFRGFMEILAIVYTTLEWWLENLSSCFKKISHGKPHLVLYSDSSNLGWGAYNKTGHGWLLFFPLWLHAGGSDLGLCGGSDLGVYLLVGWWGLVLWLFVGPTGVYLLDFFCSGIQFYLLLRPYLCFISLLYLDLCVLGMGVGGLGVFCAGQVSECLDSHLN